MFTEVRLLCLDVGPGYALVMIRGVGVMVSGVTTEAGVAVQGPQGLLVAMTLVRLGRGEAGILLVGVRVNAENSFNN